MKLQEVTENIGTYAAVRFDSETVDSLLKIIENNKIPNGLSAKEFHSTTCFSRKPLKNFKALGDFSESPWIGTPYKFGTLPNGEDKTCAILFYKCPEQDKRFKTICKEYGATWDYDEYHCHVTLSYDIGVFDVTQLNITDIEPLIIISEYTEKLDLNKYK